MTNTNKYRWNGLNIRWYIRPIRFENSIRNRIGRPIRFERKKTIRRSPTQVSLSWLLHSKTAPRIQDTACQLLLLSVITVTQFNNITSSITLSQVLTHTQTKYLLLQHSAARKWMSGSGRKFLWLNFCQVEGLGDCAFLSALTSIEDHNI